MPIHLYSRRIKLFTCFKYKITDVATNSKTKSFSFFIICNLTSHFLQRDLYSVLLILKIFDTKKPVREIDIPGGLANRLTISGHATKYIQHIMRTTIKLLCQLKIVRKDEKASVQ